MQTILIVDDDRHIQKLLTLLLEAEGYNVLVTDNAKEALKIIETELPSLVILDFMLPGTDGLEVLKQIKLTNIDTDVIAITGHGSERIAVELMKLGATDYIQKPFAKNDFITAVKRVLSSREAYAKTTQDNNILVVDDDAAVLSFVSKSLNGLGNIVVENDSRKALTLLGSEHYDIIITDVYMPHIEGIELLKRSKLLNPTTSVIIMTSSNEINLARAAMKQGANDFLVKPFKPEDIRAAVSDILSAMRKDSYKKLKKQFEFQALREEEKSDYILGSVEALIMALEARDLYTSGHSERVTWYSHEIAQRLNLSENELTTIKHSARLHDLGKIGTDDSSLYKTGKLTQEERDKVAYHPVLGAVIVTSIKMLEDYVPGIRHHHERYDGKGYPDGLKGDSIPLPARIICVADAIDAMMSSRPYRDGLPAEKVIDELKLNSGTQFDPDIVTVALTLLEAGLFHPDYSTQNETEHQTTNV
ncbi:MAG: response regulator [Deltaproteobacteria bacterium]|nr:response regulator [Deltaproteobacteria bacterium]